MFSWSALILNLKYGFSLLKSLLLVTYFWIPLHMSLNFLTERLIPPSFTKKLSETVEETEGNSFKLEGRVAGSQPISVAWYKNNIEIHPTSNCEITFKNNTLLLQIKRAGMDDAGLYTCKVSNDAGSALCTSSIVIKGKSPWLPQRDAFFLSVH